MTLLEPEERRRIRGLIINKFRGDEAILRPGLIQAGRPKLAYRCWAWCPISTLIWTTRIRWLPALPRPPSINPWMWRWVRLPRISNFTDFAPLESHPLFGVRYVQRPDHLAPPTS